MSATAQKGHPKGLYILFVTEMWERFSYYGMRAIFALFLINALKFDKATSSNIYGSYTGLVYLTPLIGGYIADRYWGNRRSIIFGGFLMAIGQFLMFMAGSLYAQETVARIMMVGGLLFLIVGNGFFKPNISTMVGQLYAPGDKRIDSAFTIFYMGINLGAFFSPIVCGALGDTGSPADFKWGFLAAGIGMIISTLLFIWLKDHYIVTPDGKPIGVGPNKSRETVDIDTTKEVKKEFTMGQIGFWAAVGVVLFCVFFFVAQFDVFGSLIFSLTISVPALIISDRTLSKIERDRIIVIYIAAFFVIFFWSAFEQAGVSLTFYAEEQTQRDINMIISPLVARVGLGLIIVALLWFVRWAFKSLSNEQSGVRTLFVAIFVACIGCSIWGMLKIPADGISLKTIPASFFQSINAVAIVIFAPMFAMIWTGLSKKNREPASPFKQAIGLLLLALGYVVIAIGVKTLAPGMKASMLWLFALYIIHTFGELCLSPIGLSMVNKLAPIKFASLLMGVWFLANATANKFAGMLSSLYPEDVKLIKEIKLKELKYTMLPAHDTVPEQSMTVRSDSAFVVNSFKEPAEVYHSAFVAQAGQPEHDSALVVRTGAPTWVLDTFELKNKKGKDSLAVRGIKNSFAAANYSIEKFRFKQIIKNSGVLTKDVDKDTAAQAKIDKDWVSGADERKVSYAFSSDGKNFLVWKKDVLEIWDLSPKKPHFLGFEITGLYEFFMIFVIMAGLASFILFGLARMMTKMMHGIR